MEKDLKASLSIRILNQRRRDRSELIAKHGETSLPELTPQAAYRAASRAVRIRTGGYAEKEWVLGYGENTPIASLWRRAGQ